MNVWDIQGVHIVFVFTISAQLHYFTFTHDLYHIAVFTVGFKRFVDVVS